MYISMNWIEDYVDLKNIDKKQLINKFTLTTAEVEDVIEYGQDIENVIVAIVEGVNYHPSNNNLVILDINIGDEVVTCVCGDKSISVGNKIPFAKCGSIVKGIEIEKTNIAGIESQGVCLSEKELGISEDNSGVMILDESYIVGRDIKEYIDIEDMVFEVDNKSLTNRPDLWGHYGIAREIAAIINRPLKEIEVIDPNEYNNLDELKISIKDSDDIYRYTAISIDNISTNISPINIKIRLNYIGVKPISLLIDLRNYVMFELGHPLSCFDNSIVKEISIKHNKKEVDLSLEDGLQKNIKANTLMIYSNELPIAIAGISIDEKYIPNNYTRSILVQSVNYNGITIRKNATKIGLRTELSARYEKILDPEITTFVIGRYLMLLKSIDNNIVVSSNLYDNYMKKFDEVVIEFDKRYVDKYTGIEISNEEIINTLRSLGFIVNNINDVFVVKVPSYRATKDISIKADIIEEIARIHGYDNFDSKSLKCSIIPITEDVNRKNEYTIKEILSSRYNLNEVNSYIWYDSKGNNELGIETNSSVKIINSINGDNGEIRESIIPTLLGFTKKNIDNFNEFGLFEIGRVVKGLNDDNLCNEVKVLSILLASKRKSDKELYFKMKEIIEYIIIKTKNEDVEYINNDLIKYNYLHPKNSSLISVNDNILGFISVVNPKISDKINKDVNIAILEIDYDLFSKCNKKEIIFNEISKYPSINYDLCLVVNNDILFKDVKSVIENYNCEYLSEITLIDVYNNLDLDKNIKSFTIRLTFESKNRTLLSEEINRYIEELLTIMDNKNIKLRR